jgi:hypothetical protein
LNQFLLKVPKSCHAFGEQTETVDHVNAMTGFAVGQSLGPHLRDHLLGNAATGGTGPDKNHALF